MGVAVSGREADDLAFNAQNVPLDIAAATPDSSIEAEPIIFQAPELEGSEFRPMVPSEDDSYLGLEQRLLERLPEVTRLSSKHCNQPVS